MPKYDIEWLGQLSGGPVAVYADGGKRLMYRDIEYTQNGRDFIIETEDPSGIRLQKVVVPRTQYAEFAKSEIAVATKWKP